MLESTRRLYEQRLTEKEAEVRKREIVIREQQSEITKARESIDEQIAAKLKAERVGIAAEEAKKARLALSNDLDQKAREVADLQEVLKQKDAKLTEAQNAQVELIRKQRELDDAKREMELTIEKRVQESLGVTRDQARKEGEEGLKLKVMEKEQTIAAMQRQIEDLKRRAEQGSQQLQGEVQELELESVLRVKFPRDTIEPVPKGEFGGDVLHRVLGPSGQLCGTILWESKRTKNWSDGWLSKLREDMRGARAEVAVVVSQVLPKDTESFNLIDGIWVTSFRCAVPVGVALRHTLIEIAATRTAGEGQQTKMEMVYQLSLPNIPSALSIKDLRIDDMDASATVSRSRLTFSEAVKWV